jgi:hypothetical protein
MKLWSFTFQQVSVAFATSQSASQRFVFSPTRDGSVIPTMLQFLFGVAFAIRRGLSD